MFSFRRSVKILPGVRLNFSKSGMSTTIGTRGATMTFSKKGTYANLGVPGTGVYMRKKISGNKPASRSTNRGTYSTSAQYPTSYSSGTSTSTYNYTPTPQVPLRSRAANQTWGFIFLVFSFITFILAFAAPLVTFGRIFIGAIGCVTLLASISYFLSKSIEDVEAQQATKPTEPIQNNKQEVTTPKPKVKKDVVEPFVPLYDIPEIKNVETAISAYRTILVNLGIAHDIFEALDVYGKGIECLKFATAVPVDPAWGDSYMGLNNKLKMFFDDAVIRLATKAKLKGEKYNDFSNYLLTDAGKGLFAKL